MPSVLSESDKETVKRTVPKIANKIQAVAVARLYVAYPSKQKWTYTGLQGAAVLANDLIGNTFWIKLVDVSPANRGVIWDQEIYEPFYYNQDRTFFHSFEMENCLAGFSFADEKEAKQFKKKMDEREKNASKATKATSFQGIAQSRPSAAFPTEKHHSRLGGIGNLLHGHRPSSTPNHSQQQSQSILPSRGAPQLGIAQVTNSSDSSLGSVDPSWRGILGELMDMGITEDQIEANADFIKQYIEQKRASEGTAGEADGEGDEENHDQRIKAPPPPPPPAAAASNRIQSLSPQNTGSTTSSRRGPPPAPPPARRARQDNQTMHQNDSPSHSPERTPSPARVTTKFRAPPPFADAGKFAHTSAPAPPARQRAPSNIANSVPPPPPRPPKTPMDDETEPQPRFGVPPAFQGERVSPVPPPHA